MSIPVLVLVGPTAAGKTDLLIELFKPGARARGLDLPDAVVVSADSMQAYRGMDIGTAKPGPAELALLPHRLLDIRDPDEQYSVGDFVGLADEACAEIAASGRLPVVAGGTGFYVRNFVCGLPGMPPASMEIRAEVAHDLERLGIDALRAELAASDPVSAERLHINDHYRICRAVEVLRQTGVPPSRFAPGPEAREGYDFLLVEVSRPREELYQRIDARVDRMFEAGLESEVLALQGKGYGPDAPGMKAIGYSEFFEAEVPKTASDKHCSPLGIGHDGIAEAIKLHSRRYAKRQETFFRGLPGLVRIELSGTGAIPEAALELGRLVSSFLVQPRLLGLSRTTMPRA